jgi:transposase
VTKRILPLIPGGLAVEQVLPAPDRITIVATARQPTADCPTCRRPSGRIHSRYERRLADLPWQSRPVAIRVRARRFFCAEPACPRRTFAERLPGIALRSARRSERLADIQRQVALALGGEAGARLSAHFAMPTSADTLLRLATSATRPEPPVPRVLGVDEWAWRKGRRYGTILVDLERSAVIDLLPDRDASSFAEWLRGHPGVEVIARDRADVYADGARRGAPRAVQVADRWHLLRNLGEAVRTIVGGHHAAVRRIQRGIAAEQAGQAAKEAAPVTTREARKAARHQPRQANYAEVRRLADAGAKVSAIARACELDRKTVRKWLREGGLGAWDRPSNPGILGPYIDRLERHWAEGPRNAARLWAELVSAGFRGGRSTVRAWATRRRRASLDTLDPKSAVREEGWKPPSVVRVARLIQADPADVGGLDGMFLNRLLAEVPALTAVHGLARGFAVLVRKEGTGTLDEWLANTAGTPLESFAEGLKKDLAAVQAALDTPWSTSPVEGQISRLKTIKIG